MYREIIFFILILLTILMTLPKSAFAWGGHKEVTYYCLRDIEWLKEFNDIKITPFNYQDPDKRTSPYEVPYKEGAIGDSTSALDILTIYCEEPDWELDKNVDSFLFKLLGYIGLDSSSWRHGYWVIGPVKLGGAPDRFIYFYNMSILAFKNNDYYWGFRFLARCLHYIEDVTQPQHTYPVPYKVILKNHFNPKRIIPIASNHHFTLERYQAYQCRTGYPKFINAIVSAKPAEVKDLRDFIVESAIKSSKKAEELWDIQSKLYGPDIDREEEFHWYPGLELDEALKTRYDDIIGEQLSDLASKVKGLVLHMREVVEGLSYPIYKGGFRSPVKQFAGFFTVKGYTSYLSRSRRIVDNRKIFPGDRF
jgi:hypothetical protein